MLDLMRPYTPTLWNDRDRERLLMRLRRVGPATRPLWGRLTAPEVLAHLGDAVRLALGEVVAPPQGRRLARLLRRAPVKQFLVYALPFPRHAPRVPALFGTPPTTWDADVAALERLLARVTARARAPRPDWPDHPYFGRLSTRAWGALGYKHMDHHLRQLGA
jgi:hypothetical protein